MPFPEGIKYEQGIKFEQGIPIADGVVADGTSQYIGGIKFEQGIKYEQGIKFEQGVFVAQNGGAELTHHDIEDLGHAPPNKLTACVIGVDPCTGTALHRNLLQWLASNLDSPDGFKAYRTAGTAVNASSVIKTLTPVALPATATSFEDSEELPDGVNFTYWTKAVFGAAETGPSIFARIKPAVNVAPMAVDNGYSGRRHHHAATCSRTTPTMTSAHRANRDGRRCW